MKQTQLIVFVPYF